MGIGCVGIAGIEVRRGGRCQMPSGGKSPDADAVGLDAQSRRAGSNGADGALCVIDHRGVVILRAQPVLQHEGRNAKAIEPFRDLHAFMIHREMHVASAWADDDGGAIGRFRQIGSDGGLVLIRRSEGARRAVGPQQFGRGTSGRRLRAGRSRSTKLRRKCFTRASYPVSSS